jgi:hypothetical protein
MKVEKYVQVAETVEVDIDMDDIREALTEAFAGVTRDMRGEKLYPNQVLRAFNLIAEFLNALTDEHIGMMVPAQKAICAQFLTKAAARFQP